MLFLNLFMIFKIVVGCFYWVVNYIINVDINVLDYF